MTLFQISHHSKKIIQISAKSWMHYKGKNTKLIISQKLGIAQKKTIYAKNDCQINFNLPYKFDHFWRKFNFWVPITPLLDAHFGGGDGGGEGEVCISLVGEQLKPLLANQLYKVHKTGRRLKPQRQKPRWQKPQVTKAPDDKSPRHSYLSLTTKI